MRHCTLFPILVCLAALPAWAQPDDQAGAGGANNEPVLILVPSDPSEFHLQQDNEVMEVVRELQQSGALPMDYPFAGGQLQGAPFSPQIMPEYLEAQVLTLEALAESSGPGFGIAISTANYAKLEGISKVEAEALAAHQRASLQIEEPDAAASTTDRRTSAPKAQAETESSEASPNTSGPAVPPTGVTHILVATVNCFVNAQNPHIGRSSGTVKAKVDASCALIPTGYGDVPDEPLILWTLVMRLHKQGSFWYPYIPGVSRPISLVTAFTRIGPLALWPPDGGAGLPGTQLDSGVCVNGRWYNFAVIRLTVPHPWIVAPLGGLVDAALRSASIEGC